MNGNPKPPGSGSVAQAANALMRLPQQHKKKAGGPTGERHSTKLAKNKFLSAFKLTGIIEHGCVEADVSRATVRRWLEKDEKFREKFVNAQESAADVAEAELWKRAIVGEQEPIISRTGEVVGYRTKKSDILLMFMLKGMRPQKFKEKMESQETNERVKAIEEELQRLGVVQKIGEGAGAGINVGDVLGGEAGEKEKEREEVEVEVEEESQEDVEIRKHNAKVINAIVTKAETHWRRGRDDGDDDELKNFGKEEE